MTDNRTNEPTEAMILAGLNAYSSKGLEIDGYETTEEYPSLEMWGDRFASQMRAALVAAQGAAPVPSSGVDEDNLVEVIEQARDRSRKDRDIAKESLGQYIARIVNERRAEWLRGTGGADE